MVIGAAAWIIETARDILKGCAPQKVAARFHNSMARAVVETTQRLCDTTGIRAVGLTGGCFQNRLLTERTVSLLEEKGLHVLLHESIPPNDGGIALGQAICARARSRKTQCFDKPARES